MRRAVIFVLVASTSTARAQHAPDAGPPPEPTAPAPAPSAPPPDMPINMPPAPEVPPDQPAAIPDQPAPAPEQPAPTPETAPAPTPAPEPAPSPEATPVPAADVVPAPEADAAPEAPAPAIGTSRNKDAAWLLVGGALTFLTAGAVLAYSTSSVEQDVRDLYVTADGSPPQFDPATQDRYEALQREGRRYEILSWASFGVAAACAAGAAVFFVRASNESTATVAPMVAPTSAGVALSLRFD